MYNYKKTIKSNKIRHIFFKTQKRYKKILKQKRRKYEEGIMNKQENLYHDNHDGFKKFLQSFKLNEK